jgi:hypothetical protein
VTRKLDREVRALVREVVCFVWRDDRFEWALRPCDLRSPVPNRLRERVLEERPLRFAFEIATQVIHHVPWSHRRVDRKESPAEEPLVFRGEVACEREGDGAFRAALLREPKVLRERPLDPKGGEGRQAPRHDVLGDGQDRVIYRIRLDRAAHLQIECRQVIQDVLTQRCTFDAEVVPN